MSQGSEAAEQMVKEGLVISEAVAKLAGAGAKNLIVLLTLYAKENQQLKGETGLKKLIKEGKELRVVYLDNAALAQFKRYAKEYGIVYTALKSKDCQDESIDVLVKAEDTPRINRILEKMNYPLPQTEEQPPKKPCKLAQSAKASSEPQIGNNMPMRENDGRCSVKERINELELLKKQVQKKYQIKSSSKEKVR